MTKILLIIQGGSLVNVITNNPEVSVQVLDYDWDAPQITETEEKEFLTNDLFEEKIEELQATLDVQALDREDEEDSL